jgi:signal transduction histidine kinase
MLASLSLILLLDRLLDVGFINRILRGTVTIDANTALYFLLAGAALFLLLQRPYWRGVALVVLIIAFVTLANYIVGGFLGINQLLLYEPRDPYILSSAFICMLLTLLLTTMTLTGLFIAGMQLREHNNKISQKNQQLEEASRMKNEFLANMSHELRTPLNAIIGFSESIKDGLMGNITETQCEYIKDIYTSGEHLLSLINDILDLSKIESGKMILELETVSINLMLQNSLNMVKGKALNYHLTLKLDVHVDTPEIIADIRKLKQIVYNLLSNAVKFTPDGGTIILAAHQVDDMLEIAVTDTGIGIAFEDQKKLFESFTQIDSVVSRQYQGTGLGLIIIKHLTELHSGSVGLESEVGKGARFWVRIPLRIPEHPSEEGCALHNRR